MNTQIPKINSRQFILAGNAIVTLKSIRTGQHFTYRITKKRNEDVWFVKCMYDYESQGFNYLGAILSDGTFIHTKASQIEATAPSFVAFNWAWSHLDNPSLEVWHEGKCGRCGKLLTDPSSIASGFGPTCKTLIAQA